MSYLRHKVTGEIYPHNDGLLRRGDFDQFETLEAAKAGVVEEVELKVETVKAAKPKARPAKKSEPAVVETPVEPEVPVEPDTGLGDLDAELQGLLGDD